MKRIIRTNHLTILYWHRMPREWSIAVSGGTVWCSLGKLTVDFGRYA